jgi:membrane-associated protein
MHTVNILRHLIEDYQLLVYIFIFLGLIIEGEFILISTGILLFLGAFNLNFVLVFIALGLFCKTFFGYHLGVRIHNKWNHTKFLKHIERRASNIMPHFTQKPFWSIFLSKFIMGANNVVIIFSGYQKVNFKKYLQAEALSTVLWAPLLIALGYFFSYTAFSISREIWRFSLVIIVLVVLFIIFDKLISYMYQLFEEFHDHTK